MATNENSVLMNLKDLFTIEADRRAADAVAKERAEVAQAARVEAERRAREHELEAARADERRRAEEERACRDAELERRLRSMREELAAVRAQREEMQLRVAEIAARPAEAPRRMSWIVGAMAAASLVAALTATAVAWPSGGQPIARLDAAAAMDVEPAPTTQSAPMPEPVVETRPADEPPPALVASVEHEPQPIERPHRRARDRARERTLTEQLDLGEGDDVLSEEDLRDVGP